MKPRWTAAIFVLLLAACAESDISPLPLWDMRAGMPFERLDSIAKHDQRERFACVASYGTYRECWLEPRGAGGRMIAIVDSAQRVAQLTYHPDVPRLSGSPRQGGGLIIETETLRRAWARKAIVIADSANLDRRSERYVTKDRRWTAHIRWAGSIFPTEIGVADEQRAKPFRMLAEAAFVDSVTRDAKRSLGEVAMQKSRDDQRTAFVEAELKRLVVAQDAHRARIKGFAANLTQLHFIPRRRINIEIAGATAGGWWARGGYEGLSGFTCLVWDGAAPLADSTGMRLGGTPREPECVRTRR